MSTQHQQQQKVKVGFFYSATYAARPRPAALYNLRKWQLIGKSQWCCSYNTHHRSNQPHQAFTT